MSNVTQALFVAWQDSAERRFHPVARLARVGDDSCEGCYEFVYIHGAREAADKGFRPFHGFPELDRAYRSDRLFPLFANRLMSSSRLDYPAYIERLGLEPGADALSVLARSGGVRTTDSVELFPLPFFSEDVGYSSPFFIHSLRYMPQEAQDRVERLVRGELLSLMLDCQNAVDPQAIALRTEDRMLIGYLPSYLLDDTIQLTCECAFLQVRVEQVNLPPAPIQQRVLCRLDACWPIDFVPFASLKYQPIPPNAAPISPTALPSVH